METTNPGVTLKLKAFNGMKRFKQVPESFEALKPQVEAFLKSIASDADIGSYRIFYNNDGPAQEIENESDYQSILQLAA